MRSFLYGAALSLALIGAARAQTVTPEGQARAVSLLTIVGGSCPAVARINQPLVDAAVEASLKIGWDMAGKAQFNSLADAELKRRMKEVRATGLKAWCNYQRPNLNAQGLKAFLD